MKFPEKLMQLLNYAEAELAPTHEKKDDCCVGWTDDGKSFVIRDMKCFYSTLVPKYFGTSARGGVEGNFIRSLYRWGFRQSRKFSDNSVSYCHQAFYRGRTDFMDEMSIAASSQLQQTTREAQTKQLRETRQSSPAAKTDAPGGMPETRSSVQTGLSSSSTSRMDVATVVNNTMLEQTHFSTLQAAALRLSEAASQQQVREAAASNLIANALVAEQQRVQQVRLRQYLLSTGVISNLSLQIIPSNNQTLAPSGNAVTPLDAIREASFRQELQQQQLQRREEAISRIRQAILLSGTNVSHNIVRNQANDTIAIEEVIEEAKSDVQAATRNERTALDDVDVPTPAKKRHRRT